MKEKKQKADLSALLPLLPNYVPRNWSLWNERIPWIKSRSIANDDCKGRGVKQRVYIGNVCCYEKHSLIEYLENKSRVIE